MSYNPTGFSGAGYCTNTRMDPYGQCDVCGKSFSTNHILHGWYSTKSEQKFGAFEVLTPGGQTVRITAIMHSADGKNYNWPDKQYMGEILTGTQKSVLGNFSVRVAPVELKLGDTCPKCRAVVKERQLFTGTFVGCMC